MYSIAHNGGILFDPRLDGYPLQAPKLSREANKIGTFSFSIYPGNPEYGRIFARSSTFTIQKDGVVYWMGRASYKKQLFRGGMEWKCEELTARLNDFQLRPTVHEGTAAEFLAYVLGSYNAMSGDGLFEAGTVTVAEPVDIETDYTGHLDALYNYLVKPLGGYLIPRYESGRIYLDYLREEDLPLAAQAIVFGENLTDLMIETDADALSSRLIPIGKNDSNGAPVNITSVNGGADFIEVASPAPREVVRKYDIDDPQELLEAAWKDLDASALRFRQTVKLTAIDLHNADASIESFDFMQRIRAESSRHGIAETYVLSREELPLGSPDGAVISLGATKETMTEAVSVQSVTQARATAQAAQQSASAAQAMASATVGPSGSESLFYVTVDAQDRPAIKVNPNYRFIVGSYDVEEALSS